MAIHVKFPNFVNAMSNDLKSYFRNLFWPEIKENPFLRIFKDNKNSHLFLNMAYEKLNF